MYYNKVFALNSPDIKNTKNIKNDNSVIYVVNI